jgi:hypothetical protein
MWEIMNKNSMKKGKRRSEEQKASKYYIIWKMWRRKKWDGEMEGIVWI